MTGNIKDRSELHICNEEKNQCKQSNSNKSKKNDGRKANGVEVIFNINLKLLKTRKRVVRVPAGSF